MKKNESSLLKKAFDLKKSNIYGGKDQEPTYKTTTTTTKQLGCTYQTTTTTDDNGKFISSCTDVTCP